MSDFNDFDLDLRGNGEGTSMPAGVSITTDGFCDTDVITSFVNCTQNGQYVTCLCSICCTGHTAPAGCSLGC